MASPDDDGFHVLKEPTGCILWREPERIESDRAAFFECLETFEDDSHLTRHLFKCRECGQLYFYEFYEEIDWDEGDDWQYWTYIPVTGDADVEMMLKESPIGLLRFTPRLQRDFPKGAKTVRIAWIR
jgi:hypothetical protein